MISSNDTVLFLRTICRRMAGFLVSATVGAATVMADTADLGIRISVQPGPVVLGNRIELSIVVTNRGPSSASGVTVAYALPSALDLPWAVTSVPVSPLAKQHGWSVRRHNGIQFAAKRYRSSNEKECND